MLLRQRSLRLLLTRFAPGVSYVGRAVRAVAAEGLPLLLADANPWRASEAAAWALSQPPGTVCYVRVPDAAAERVADAAAQRAAARAKLLPPGAQLLAARRYAQQ